MDGHDLKMGEPMNTILILNARIINENIETQGDILIKDGRIQKIGKDLSGQKTVITIDAKERVLMPGMIDDQVHFREPGLTHKGDIRSESMAAVAGGITTFMDMPNTTPPTTSLSLLKEKFHLAEENAFANYSFYLGGSNTNIDEIKSFDPSASCGIKVFMGASTGNMLVDDPNVLEQIFTHSPGIVAVHCEDTPMITENTRQAKERYADAIPMSSHPLIRSEAACFKSSSLAVELAEKCNTRLHLLHLTTAKELSLLSDHPLDQKKITAEACVHHLFFTERDYEEKGTLIKCNPAIKTEHDRDQLVLAVKSGKIDVIGTDHAPHTLMEKMAPYVASPSGLPLVEFALVSLLEKYHDKIFSLGLIAEKTAHAPARLFNIKDRGYIREGFWADLVLVELDRPFDVDEKPVLTKCGWTPFSGYTFRSTIAATFVSGHLAYVNGKIDPIPAGRRIQFNR